MDKAFHSVSRGLLLITLGVIFLLGNYNILNSNFWRNSITFWPIILILSGVALFFNRRIPLSLVLTIFLLGLVIFSMTVGTITFGI